MIDPETAEQEDAALAAAPWPQRFLFERLQNAGEIFLLVGSALREMPSGVRKTGLIFEQMASICSVTRMEPSSAAIAALTRPPTTSAVSTGPSSITTDFPMTVPR